MNIMFVASVYSDWGKPNRGFPYYIYKVTHALKQMNHNPMILALGKGNFYRVEDGIPIWTVSNDCPNRGKDEKKIFLNYMCLSYAINKKLQEILNTVQVDIIQFTSLNGLATCYNGNKPTVLRLSSYHKICFPDESTFSKKTVNAISFMEQLSAKNCDAVFAPANVTARFFGKDVRRNVDVIETPFIFDEPILDESCFTRHFAKKKYILFFGTLYAAKGIKVIAKILEKFLHTHEDLYFAFVGDTAPVDGESAVKLLHRSAGTCIDRLVILDALPHKQLYPIIKRAEFVVMPSVMDNLPNACIEAMYLKQVVIGTNGASFEQLIENGKSGFLCKINDAEDLYDKMCQVSILSPKQREEIGERARARIDKMRPEIVVTKLVEYYQKIIETHSSTTRFCGLGMSAIAKVLKVYDNLFYKVARIQKTYDKSTRMWLVFQHWFEISKNGTSVAEYLLKHGYKKIAVYGMGDLGKTLVNELQDTDVAVSYAIDMLVNNIVSSIEILNWEMDWPKVDAVIVSPVNIYHEIKSDIQKKSQCDVLSLESIILSL